jgi:hypothetical protein
MRYEIAMAMLPATLLATGWLLRRRAQAQASRRGERTAQAQLDSIGSRLAGLVPAPAGKIPVRAVRRRPF